tara:strand:- start:80 stop:385 length:306 start_codon:yes stop_codon:yes gene_type:complete
MIVTIVVLTLLTLFFCWLTKGYFVIQRKLKNKPGYSNRTLEYLIFIPFISVLIPGTMYFPAWLANYFSDTEISSETTLLFFIIGAIILIAVLTYGWKSAIK